ncbi:MAG: arginine deiminase [Ruthenibacterium sp.]
MKCETPISVKSETAQLRRVLLHRPGKELEHLSPDTLERLLFDDIPYLHGAQSEHDEFARILRQNGVEVCYLEDLVAETLQATPTLRAQFVHDFIDVSGEAANEYRVELSAFLLNLQDEKELVLKTMAGINAKELSLSNHNPLADFLSSDSRFLTDPIPNLYFTRDPFACIGNGVALNRMYSITRRRETLYGSYVLHYHPDYAKRVPLFYRPEMPYNIEGGDVLNLNSHVIAVGASQRTQPEAIEILAKTLFADEQCEIDTVLAFEIPRIRAFMHLDTVFTQVDVDKFTVHPAILQKLRTFEITPDKNSDIKVRELTGTLEETLAHYLQVDAVTLIHCGGANRVASEREQWNDGSNTLCIAPGVVATYNRNYITNELLEQQGITVLEIPSAELSRGRGGPRCMSMPLVRASVE